MTELRVLVAPDSFKGTLSADAAATAMARGILRVNPRLRVEAKPMADGGEGTLAAVLSSRAGRRVQVETRNPLDQPCRAAYAQFADGEALVELAVASGLPLIATADKGTVSGLRASTYGTGVLIADALHRGNGRLLLAQGGSATTDGGFGLLAALGARYWDASGRVLPGRDARQLATVARIDVSAALPALRQTQWVVACDVDNPLCGVRGAAAVYGPQKGLTAAAVCERDAQLSRWLRLLLATATASGLEPDGDVGAMAGIGAAGGAAVPLVLFGAATLVPGAKMVADAIGLEASVRQSDLVFTGEGRSDAQSAMGKAPCHVSATAMRHGKPCLLLSGALGAGYEQLAACGVVLAAAASPADAAEEELARFAADWLEAGATALFQRWLGAAAEQTRHVDPE